MRRLTVLKAQRTEDADSPEFEYLFSFCLAQAKKVFDTVTAQTYAPERLNDIPPPKADGQDAILLFGVGNVLLGAASLERMWTALEHGADVVVPSPLHHHAAARGEELFTLRGFERVEEQILRQDERPVERPSSHLPIALLSPSAYREWTASAPLDALLTDERWCAQTERDLPCAQGVYHLFVDYYGQLRDDILPFLPEHANDVLEIGCARGWTGAWIQEQLGCRVTGVDLNAEAAAEARTRLHQVLVGNIEDLTIEGRFDAVVATELFEHLNYPERFLEKMKAVLVPGGRIVLSVPNVGHYSVVEDLLAGRWDYLPIGLLCYTHFRFFTRATLEDWIRRADFSTHRLVPQTTDLPERIAALAGHLEADLDSLRTKGFYVILER